MSFLNGELEDLRNFLRGKGYNIDDFQISVTIDKTAEKEYVKQGNVKIERLSNGRHNTYRAGHGFAFPNDVIEDIESGCFGYP